MIIDVLQFDTLQQCEAAIARIDANGRALFSEAGYDIDENGYVIGKDLSSKESRPESQVTETWDEPHLYNNKYWIRDPQSKYPTYYNLIMSGVGVHLKLSLENPYPPENS